MGKIPMVKYQAYAREFNPVKYDPLVWVKLAKAAGMKYIVITTKHHDCFAMFETKASPLNIIQATPYGKDVIKPLAEACRAEGIKLGFYYSQAQDWNNGGFAHKGRWDPAQTGAMPEYIDKITVPPGLRIAQQLWHRHPCHHLVGHPFWHGQGTGREN